MQEKRSTGRRPLILVLGLVAALALGEVTLRALHGAGKLQQALHLSTAAVDYSRAETLPELLDMTPFGHRPNTRAGGFVLNSRGLRDEEYQEAKADGTLRVVVLGDSFTFSSGNVPWESLWHVRLERALAERTGRPVEVISLGVPATGPAFHLRMWEVEGRRLDPDLVLLAFFVGNDFMDGSGGAMDTSLGGKLVRHSLLARLVRNTVAGERARPAEAEAAEADTDEVARGGRERTNGGRPVPGYTYDALKPSYELEAFHRIVRSRFVLAHRPQRETFMVQFRRVAEILQDLRRDVVRAGSRLAVLIMPAEYQIDDGVLRAALEGTGLDHADMDIDSPQRRILALMEGEGAATLDLRPAFLEAAATKKLYRLQDTHWNEEGNALASEVILDFFEERELLPSD